MYLGTFGPSGFKGYPNTRHHTAARPISLATLRPFIAQQKPTSSASTPSRGNEKPLKELPNGVGFIQRSNLGHIYRKKTSAPGSHMIQGLATYSDLAAQPPGRLSGDPLRTSRMHAHGRNCSSPHPRRPWSELCTRLESCSQANSGVARVIRRLPFIPHLPVTGVKNSGISSCSTFFLSDAITKTRSMTLSG